MKIRESIAGIRAYVPGKPIEETAREIGMRPDEIIKLASNEIRWAHRRWQWRQ